MRADAAQLERVFSNLIENAIKFSPPRTLRSGSPAAPSAGRVTVRVIDRGRGIPRRYRAQVFEPFFRGPRAGSGSGAGGSGLGLAICRGFVEANGGRIVLQTGRDTGTIVRGQLPGAAPARERTVGLDERSAAPRVLVVDDEPQIVRGLKIILRSAGYAVEAAETKAEALVELVCAAARRARARPGPARRPRASRSARRSGAGAGCRSWSSRPSATSARRSARSTPAPTTT